MPSSRGSFLRQLSGREAWRAATSRGSWSGNRNFTSHSHSFSSSSSEMGLTRMEGLFNTVCGGGYCGGGYGYGEMSVTRKRVMVVVDNTSHSKHAMMWALTHVTNKGDLLTLLHVVTHESSIHDSPHLASSLGSLCKACRPEVEVEALVIQGPKLATVMSQVKKLEVSVLVLGQRKPIPFISCLCGPSSSEEFVEKCINGADCLTIGVRKQSKGVGGYLISTRWRKNFWLLA